MLRGLRIVLAVVVAIAAWLVTSPAQAAVNASDPRAPQRGTMSAPQCDPRAAITFAPTPTLDPPVASIDVGDANDCDAQRLLGWSSYEQGHPPAADCCSTVPEAVLGAASGIARAPLAGIAPHASVVMASPNGVRPQVERPPRV